LSRKLHIERDGIEGMKVLLRGLQTKNGVLIDRVLGRSDLRNDQQNARHNEFYADDSANSIM
jgi:hypothetical protein